MDNLFSKLVSCDVVTFDMFDTLVTRCFLLPDDLFLIVDKYVSLNYGMNKGWFFNIRKKSLRKLQQKARFSDFTINEIYDEIEKQSTLTHKDIEKIKNYEIQTDLKFLIPREDVQYIFYKLLERGKKIIIISDTYYTKSIMNLFLQKCGYKGYSQVMVSCEFRKKKSTGRLWKLFFKNNKAKTCHVGDSKLSDAFRLFLLGKPHIRIYSPKALLSKSNLSWSNKNVELSILNGLIYNKCLFNSPFTSITNSINKSSKIGYAFFGPLLLHFYIWLSEVVKKNQILFLSREGYYLQKMYKYFCSKFHMFKEIENKYLLASRRSATFCGIFDWKDIKKICLWKPYRGSIKFFFKNRFNISIKEKDFNVFIPFSRHVVLKLAKKYECKILSNARLERQNYLNYLKTFVKRNAFIVDIGYHGTCQLYLSKILKFKLKGAYMLKSIFDYAKKWGNCKSYSCYKPILTGIAMRVFALLVELIFIAPHGQFVRFNERGRPEYNKLIQTKQQIRSINLIFEGVKMFFDDLSFYLPNFIDKPSFLPKQIYRNFYKCYRWMRKGECPDDLADALIFEDNIVGKNGKKIWKR